MYSTVPKIENQNDRYKATFTQSEHKTEQNQKSLSCLQVLSQQKVLIRFFDSYTTCCSGHSPRFGVAKLAGH